MLLGVNYNNDNITFGNDVFVWTINEKLEKEELERKEKEEYTETFIKKKLFGRYPQTKVTDTCLINSLKNIFDRNEYGYIEYNHQEYHEYNDDFYLVEPIKWKILEENNNMFCIMSEEILDRRLFYSSETNKNINGKVIYPNNYEYSDLRAWLNGYDESDYSVLNYANNGFIGIAFNKKEKEMIMESMIDNSAQSTRRLDNAYVCNDVKDKIYLMSYEEISKIYFDNNDQRKANATGFAIAKVDNKYKSDLKYFWLLSPRYHDSTESYSKCNRLVDICKTDGIRPVLKLKIE